MARATEREETLSWLNLRIRQIEINIERVRHGIGEEVKEHEMKEKIMKDYEERIEQIRRLQDILR